MQYVMRLCESVTSSSLIRTVSSAVSGLVNIVRASKALIPRWMKERMNIMRRAANRGLLLRDEIFVLLINSKTEDGMVHSRKTYQ